MRNVLFTLLLLLYQSGLLLSQDCLPQGITFHTQAEIDQFPANYPGCHQIKGVVYVMGADITNLDSLHVIQALGASLYIHFNPQLTSLKGLSNLQAIGTSGLVQSMFITDNPKLKNLDGLEQLTTVGGYLDISSNDNLENLNSLSHLRSVGKNFYLQDNVALRNLNGLKSLQSVGDDFLVESSPLLQDLTGLDSLAWIGGSFYIQFNEHLSSLAGLCAELRIQQFLALTLNLELTDCALPPICRVLKTAPGNFLECSNGPGCAAPAEILGQCQLLAASATETTRVNIGPNPFVDYLDFTTENNLQIKVSDMLGRVYCQKTIHQQEQLETSHWQTGYYLIEIAHNAVHQTFKFVKPE